MRGALLFVNVGKTFSNISKLLKQLGSFFLIPIQTKNKTYKNNSDKNDQNNKSYH